METHSGCYVRLPRRVFLEGVYCILSLCVVILYGAQSVTADPAPSSPVDDTYAAIFPRKADITGKLLPSKVGTYRLNGSRKIEIRAQVPGVCFFGDRDVLLLEAGWGKFEEVLVSIEPLDASGGKGVSTRVKVKELGSGSALVRLTVPKSSRPTPMGLFICKDEARQGSCRDKNLVELASILEKFHDPAKPENLNPKKDFPEVVYFFTHMTVGPDSVSWTESQYTQEERARMSAVIDEAVPHDQATRVKKKLDALQKTLNSAPVVEVDGKLSIALPGFNTAGCPAG